MEIRKINALGNTFNQDTLRKNRFVEIIQKSTKNNDDYTFIHNFIKSYSEDLNNRLKNLNLEALHKIFSVLRYKSIKNDDITFTTQELTNDIFFVLNGKVKLVDSNSTTKEALIKTFDKGSLIHSADLSNILTPGKTISGIADNQCELLMISTNDYNGIFKEQEDKAKDSKIALISKHFAKFKKLDRPSKEINLNHFKSESFLKGCVIINIKAKIEDLYLIEKGRIALVIPNNYNKIYTKKYIIFAILEDNQIFNEHSVILEKESPYYAISLEDTDVLSIEKSNLSFLTDYQSAQDLRANSQGKDRLFKAYIDKFEKWSLEEIEKNQNSMLTKGRIDYKYIDDILSKGNLKGISSNHYLKNLEKFNNAMGKKNDTSYGDQKLGVFATPRLASKDPEFKALNPERQRAMESLRIQGMARRSGMATNQVNAQIDDKNEVAKIVNKKNISEGFNLNGAQGEEEKSDLSLLKKLQKGNEELLMKLGSHGPQHQQPTNENIQIKGNDEEEIPQESAINKPPTKEGDNTSNNNNKSDDVQKSNKSMIDFDEVDELGLKMTQKNLSTIKNSSATKNFPMIMGSKPKLQPTSTSQAENIKMKANKLKGFI